MDIVSSLAEGVDLSSPEAPRRQREFPLKPRRASPIDPGTARDRLKIGQCQRRPARWVTFCVRAANNESSLKEPLFATPNYVVMSLHISFILFSSVMSGIRQESADFRWESIASESLVALGNNGTSRESLANAKTESVGRGFEPRPPPRISPGQQLLGRLVGLGIATYPGDRTQAESHGLESGFPKGVGAMVAQRAA